MPIWRQSKYKPILQSISIVLACTFLLPSLTWAFESNNFQTNLNPVYFKNQAIEIPRQYADTSQVFQGDDTVVIHIQDLHCNDEVQMNIAKIIALLTERYGLQLVAVEGASRPVNVSKFRSFPIKPVVEEVARYFVRLGKLSGAEYYAATGKNPIRLEGIETRDLYAANKKTVAALLSDESQGYVMDLREGLNGLKPGIYNPRLLSFDQRRTAFREGKLGARAYSRFLMKTARSLGIDLADAAVLSAYTQSEDSVFPEAVDPDRLSQEQDALDAKIRQQLYIRTAESELDVLQHRLDILEKFINISATDREIAEFKENPQLFAVRVFTDFVHRFQKEASLELDPEIFHLDHYLEEAAGFYQVADQRSLHFVANLKDRMQAQHQKLAVLVTGGYHTDAVLAELKKQGISYLSLKPRLVHQDLVNPYYSLLKNRLSPLDKLLAQNQNSFTLEPYLPQEDPAIIPNETRLGLREKLFSRSVELYLKLRAAFHFYLENKIGQALTTSVNQANTDYLAGTDTIQVDALQVKVHAGKVLSCPVQVNHAQHLSLYWPQNLRSPVRDGDAAEIATLGNARLAIVAGDRSEAVLTALGDQPSLGLRDVKGGSLIGLYLSLTWTRLVADKSRQWLGGVKPWIIQTAGIRDLRYPFITLAFSGSGLTLPVGWRSPIVGAEKKPARSSAARRISPDLARTPISHALRNGFLAAMIQQASVYRITTQGKIALQFYLPRNVFAFVANVLSYGLNLGLWSAAWGRRSQVQQRVFPRLERIRGTTVLEAAVQKMDLQALSGELRLTQEIIRQRLVAIARNVDILTVAGRFTLHPDGPMGHARAGLTGRRDPAIWLGEKLFTAPEIDDGDIALLLLEEAQHILAPEYGHDVVPHSKTLFAKLERAALGAGEVPGTTECERDMAETAGTDLFQREAQVARELRDAATAPFRLNQLATIMPGVKLEEHDEAYYRNTPLREILANHPYPADSEKDVTNLVKYQSDAFQAMLEMIANAQDAYLLAAFVGRFGVGAFQAFSELKNGNHMILLESSMDGEQGVRFAFWKEGKDIFFNYTLLGKPMAQQGTAITVLKSLSLREIQERVHVIQRKVQANDRGVILVNGQVMNHPEAYKIVNTLEVGIPPNAAQPAEFKIGFDGYQVRDHGKGMGLKAMFEKFLSKTDDKKLTHRVQAVESVLRYTDKIGDRTDASLYLSGFEIEDMRKRMPSDRLNLIGEMVVVFPHDSRISEDRKKLYLTGKAEDTQAAVTGMKFLIDKLTDPQRKILRQERFALLNSLALVLRKKQPEKDLGTTENLLAYLKARIEATGLLTADPPLTFLPNKQAWGVFQGQENVVLLDEALFDSAAALRTSRFEDISRHPGFQSLSGRFKVLVADFGEAESGPIVVQDEIQGQPVLILKRAAYEEYKNDPEVLLARIRTSLGQARVQAETVGQKPALRKNPIQWNWSIKPLKYTVATLAIVIFGWVTFSGWRANAGGIKTWLDDTYSALLRKATGRKPATRLEPGPAGQAAKPLAPERANSGYEKGFPKDPLVSAMVPPIPTGHYRGSFYGPLIKHVYTKLRADGDWESGPVEYKETGELLPGQTELTLEHQTLSRVKGRELWQTLDSRVVSASVDPEDQGAGLRVELKGNILKPAPGQFSTNRLVTIHWTLQSLSASKQLTVPATELEKVEAESIPGEWTKMVDKAKKTGDSAQVKAVVDKIVSNPRWFVVDASQPYMRDTTSWMHTLSTNYYQKGVAAPMQSKTAALYKYILYTYGGLPTVYLDVENTTNTKNNTFYQNQTDAAWLAVNVKNSWQTDDPLRLMAKKIPTPSYYAMTNEPSTKIGEPSAKPETLPEKKAETVNPQSHEQKPVAEPAKAPETKPEAKKSAPLTVSEQLSAPLPSQQTFSINPGVQGHDAQSKTPVKHISVGKYTGERSYFIMGIYPHLLENGLWESGDVALQETGGKVLSDKVQVELYHQPLAGSMVLFQELNGRVKDVRVTNEDTGPGVQFQLEGTLLQLLPNQDLGRRLFTVSYTIEHLSQNSKLVYTDRPLPRVEIDNLPGPWKSIMDEAKRKVAATGDQQEIIKAAKQIHSRWMRYDQSRTFQRDDVSWTHTATEDLKTHPYLSIICNVNALYFYELVRYGGLRAARLDVKETAHHQFWANLADHSIVAAEVNGTWGNYDPGEYIGAPIYTLGDWSPGTSGPQLTLPRIQEKKAELAAKVEAPANLPQPQTQGLGQTTWEKVSNAIERINPWQARTDHSNQKKNEPAAKEEPQKKPSQPEAKPLGQETLDKVSQALQRFDQSISQRLGGAQGAPRIILTGIYVGSVFILLSPLLLIRQVRKALYHASVVVVAIPLGLVYWPSMGIYRAGRGLVRWAAKLEPQLWRILANLGPDTQLNPVERIFPWGVVHFKPRHDSALIALFLALLKSEPYNLQVESTHENQELTLQFNQKAVVIQRVFRLNETLVVLGRQGRNLVMARVDENGVHWLSLPRRFNVRRPIKTLVHQDRLYLANDQQESVVVRDEGVGFLTPSDLREAIPGILDQAKLGLNTAQQWRFGQSGGQGQLRYALTTKGSRLELKDQGQTVFRQDDYFKRLGVRRSIKYDEAPRDWKEVTAFVIITFFWVGLWIGLAGVWIYMQTQFPGPGSKNLTSFLLGVIPRAAPALLTSWVSHLALYFRTQERELIYWRVLGNNLYLINRDYKDHMEIVTCDLEHGTVKKIQLMPGASIQAETEFCTVIAGQDAKGQPWTVLLKREQAMSWPVQYLGKTQDNTFLTWNNNAQALRAFNMEYGMVPEVLRVRTPRIGQYFKDHPEVLKNAGERMQLGWVHDQDNYYHLSLDNQALVCIRGSQETNDVLPVVPYRPLAQTLATLTHLPPEAFTAWEKALADIQDQRGKATSLREVAVRVNEHITGWAKNGKVTVNRQSFPLEPVSFWQGWRNRYRLRVDSGSYFPLLDSQARQAMENRQARIRRPSLAWFYMDPWIDYFSQDVSSAIVQRCEQLVKKQLTKDHQAASQQALHDVLGMVGLFYIHDLYNANQPAAHFLDLAEHSLEQARHIRLLLLRTWQVPGQAEPITGLEAIDRIVDEKLPADLRFVAQLLRGDLEQMLPQKEPEEIPRDSGNPPVVLDGGGESLAKLVDVASRYTNDEIKTQGLKLIKDGYEHAGVATHYDATEMNKAFNNQVRGVWIRELVQNSRNAWRRLLGTLSGVKIEIESYRWNNRWYVSVKDKVGMTPDVIFKKLLNPEATTNTLEEDVASVLRSLPNAAAAARAEAVAGRCLQPEVQADAGRLAEIKQKIQTVLQAGGSLEQMAGRVVTSIGESQMKKQTSGKFGIGFFTIFSEEEILIRSGTHGRVYDVRIQPVLDADGQLVDIKHLGTTEHPDPDNQFQGTEIRLMNTITPENEREIFVRNAYLRFQAMKLIGAITDSHITWNQDSLRDEMEEIASVGRMQGEDGNGLVGSIRSRLSSQRIDRETVDELYVEDLPEELLALVPERIRMMLQTMGLNLEFDQSTDVVRTRNSLQNPERYRPQVGVLIMRTVAALYQQGKMDLPGLPARYLRYLLSSPWNGPVLPAPVLVDAEFIRSGQASKDTDEARIFWERFEQTYAKQESKWQQLLLAVDSGLEPRRQDMHFHRVPQALRDYFTELQRYGQLPQMPNLEERSSLSRPNQSLLIHLQQAGQAFREGLGHLGGMDYAAYLDTDSPWDHSAAGAALAEKINEQDYTALDEITPENWVTVLIHLRTPGSRQSIREAKVEYARQKQLEREARERAEQERLAREQASSSVSAQVPIVVAKDASAHVVQPAQSKAFPADGNLPGPKQPAFLMDEPAGQAVVTLFQLFSDLLQHAKQGQNVPHVVVPAIDLRALGAMELLLSKHEITPLMQEYLGKALQGTEKLELSFYDQWMQAHLHAEQTVTNLTSRFGRDELPVSLRRLEQKMESGNPAGPQAGFGSSLGIGPSQAEKAAKYIKRSHLLYHSLFILSLILLVGWLPGVSQHGSNIFLVQLALLGIFGLNVAAKAWALRGGKDSLIPEEERQSLNPFVRAHGWLHGLLDHPGVRWLDQEIVVHTFDVVLALPAAVVITGIGAVRGARMLAFYLRPANESSGRAAVEPEGRSFLELRPRLLRLMLFLFTPELDLRTPFRVLPAWSSLGLGLAKILGLILVALAPQRQMARLASEPATAWQKRQLISLDGLEARGIRPDQYVLRPLSQSTRPLLARWWQGSFLGDFAIAENGNFIIYIPDSLYWAKSGDQVWRQLFFDLVVWSNAAKCQRLFIDVDYSERGGRQNGWMNAFRVQSLQLALLPSAWFPARLAATWHGLWMARAPLLYLQAVTHFQTPTWLGDRLQSNTADPGLRAAYLQVCQNCGAGEIQAFLEKILAEVGQSPVDGKKESLLFFQAMLRHVPCLRLAQKQSGDFLLPALRPNRLGVYLQLLNDLGIFQDRKPNPGWNRPVRTALDCA